MTREEFKKVKFRMVAHFAMEHEHCCTYKSEDGRIGVCVHTRKKSEYEFGRSYRHYKIDGKVYKTDEKFYEALKDYHPAMTVEKLKELNPE